LQKKHEGIGALVVSEWQHVCNHGIPLVQHPDRFGHNSSEPGQVRRLIPVPVLLSAFPSVRTMCRLNKKTAPGGAVSGPSQTDLY
jgi:hypothetical protein